MQVKLHLLQGPTGPLCCFESKAFNHVKVCSNLLHFVCSHSSPLLSSSFVRMCREGFPCVVVSVRTRLLRAPRCGAEECVKTCVG